MKLYIPTGRNVSFSGRQAGATQTVPQDKVNVGVPISTNHPGGTEQKVGGLWFWKTKLFDSQKFLWVWFQEVVWFVWIKNHFQKQVVFSGGEEAETIHAPQHGGVSWPQRFWRPTVLSFSFQVLLEAGRASQMHRCVRADSFCWSDLLAPVGQVYQSIVNLSTVQGWKFRVFKRRASCCFLLFLVAVVVVFLLVCCWRLVVGSFFFFEAYFRRGQAHLELRSLDEAKEDFERARELEPDPAIDKELKRQDMAVELQVETCQVFDWIFFRTKKLRKPRTDLLSGQAQASLLTA